MKKQLHNKLVLHRITIANLSQQRTKGIMGGWQASQTMECTIPPTCMTGCASREPMKTCGEKSCDNGVCYKPGSQDDTSCTAIDGQL
jgi:hypothetical protein